MTSCSTYLAVLTLPRVTQCRLFVVKQRLIVRDVMQQSARLAADAGRSAVSVELQRESVDAARTVDVRDARHYHTPSAQ